MSYYFSPVHHVSPAVSGRAQEEIAIRFERGETSGYVIRQLQHIKHGVRGDPHCRPDNPYAMPYNQDREAMAFIEKHKK